MLGKSLVVVVASSAILSEGGSIKGGLGVGPLLLLLLMKRDVFLVAVAVAVDVHIAVFGKEKALVVVVVVVVVVIKTARSSVDDIEPENDTMMVLIYLSNLLYTS